MKISGSLLDISFKEGSDDESVDMIDANLQDSNIQI